MLNRTIQKQLPAIIVGAMLACACAITLSLPASAYAASGELVHFKFDGNYKTSVGKISTVHYGQSEFGAGKIGKAAFFDGDDDYVTAGRGLNLPGDFTLNVWVKPVAGNETRETAGLFTKFEEDTGSYGFFLRYNKPAVGMIDESGGNPQVVSETALQNEEWYMLTYTYKAKGKKLSIYINGKYDSSFEYGPFLTGNDLVTIGRQAWLWDDGGNLEYRGWLDELSLYNKSLTSAQIKVNNISKAKVSGLSKTYAYVSNAVKPSPKLTIGSKTLRKGTDYTISYKNNNKFGTASMVVSGKGSYYGSKTMKFKLVPKGTKISSLEEGNKSLKIAWTKQSKKTSGYQIRYSTKKSMKNAKLKTVMSPKKASATLKGLKNGKAYWVQVRTYTKIGNSIY